jgi:hypothetical protein
LFVPGQELQPALIILDRPDPGQLHPHQAGLSLLLGRAVPPDQGVCPDGLFAGDELHLQVALLADLEITGLMDDQANPSGGHVPGEPGEGMRTDLTLEAGSGGGKGYIQSLITTATLAAAVFSAQTGLASLREESRPEKHPRFNIYHQKFKRPKIFSSGPALVPAPYPKDDRQRPFPEMTTIKV